MGAGAKKPPAGPVMRVGAFAVRLRRLTPRRACVVTTERDKRQRPAPDLVNRQFVASGINQMDASGDEALRHLVERLRASDIQVVFCGVKKQVLDVMRRTELDRLIGEANLHPNEEQALAAIYTALGRDGRGELLPAQSAQQARAP